MFTNVLQWRKLPSKIIRKQKNTIKKHIKKCLFPIKEKQADPPEPTCSAMKKIPFSIQTRYFIFTLSNIIPGFCTKSIKQIKNI